MLDSIIGESYGANKFKDIIEKHYNISQNNNAWSTRNVNTTRNTFALQVVLNWSNDDIHEEMTQFMNRGKVSVETC